MVEQPATVDEYIASFPDEVQVVLEKVRQSIRNVAPEAGETISYKIPTMTLDGRYLVYFAGWQHHISLYPLPGVDDDLEHELARYRTGTGTLRFPLNEPIPYDLIKRVVTLLAQQRSADR
jgi:uncharacterized protein YdhG (YjbR/CyaY superfamily)